MSREVGTQLPADLKAVLESESPRLNAVPLISTDARGFPHVALISYFELFLKHGMLHFFIASGSRSAGFLDHRPPCCLIFVQRDFVYYLKAQARRLGVFHGQALFRLRIESLWEDFPTAEEGDALLSSGIRFKSSQEDLKRRLSLRQRIMSGE